MVQLLFFIILGIAIYKNIQRAQERNGMKDNNAGSNTMSNQKGAPVNPAVPVNRNMQMGKVQQKTATVIKPSAGEAKEDGNTTTAYLKEKAEEDAREHAKEKFEEQKRLYETRGGLAVAERYLEGDLIPRGKRRVKCGYCGAENLVPMQPRARYSCYFCREAL